MKPSILPANWEFTLLLKENGKFHVTLTNLEGDTVTESSPDPTLAYLNAAETAWSREGL